MRRKDREMDRAFAYEVLDQCTYAVLGTVNPDGSPYCIPISIVRENDCLFFHCAKAGQKIQNLRSQARVCLTAVRTAKTVPEKFTVGYESAVITGTAEEIAEADKAAALRLLCERHVPSNMEQFEEDLCRNLSHTAVWKIQIETVSGKRNPCGLES